MSACLCPTHLLQQAALDEDLTSLPRSRCTGGAFAVDSGASLSFDGRVEASANRADLYGGAVWLEGPSAALVVSPGASFKANSAYLGGFLATDSAAAASANVSLSGLILENNTGSLYALVGPGLSGGAKVCRRQRCRVFLGALRSLSSSRADALAHHFPRSCFPRVSTASASPGPLAFGPMHAPSRLHSILLPLRRQQAAARLTSAQLCMMPLTTRRAAPQAASASVHRLCCLVCCASNAPPCLASRFVRPQVIDFPATVVSLVCDARFVSGPTAGGLVNTECGQSLLLRSSAVVYGCVSRERRAGGSRTAQHPIFPHS